IGPIAAWRNARIPDLWTRLQWAAYVALAAGALLPFTLGQWKPLVALGLLLCAWIVAGTLTPFLHRLRGSPHPKCLDRRGANTAALYGMLLAHLGVAVFIAGVTLVKGYEIERDVRLDVGQSVDIAGDTYTFRGVVPNRGPNYDALTATVDVSRNGKAVATLH